MKPVTLAFLLVLAVVPSPRLAGGDDVSIRVLPGRVYPQIVYKLRVECDGDAPGAYWRWSATGGEMLSKGEREVYWRSPPRPGLVTLRAALLDADGEETDRRGELEVEIERPSTEGMVLVPAGAFIMGDSWTDEDAPGYVRTEQNVHDKPPREVSLDAFWIDRNKVTNREFADFLNDFLQQGLVRVIDGAVVGLFQGVEVPFYFFEVTSLVGDRPHPGLRRAIGWDRERFHVRAGTSDHPVMDVTWAGAVTYAFYHGRRLPTEAEWEKAARGMGERRFPWGDELPTRYHANINEFFGDADVPVGSFSPLGDSPFGVADVLGGYEWVHDWFAIHYFPDVASDLPLERPKGLEWGVDHVVRGVAVYDKFLGGDLNVEPLANRYQWIFVFEQGHLFAHKDTGFRTALTPLTDEE